MKVKYESSHASISEGYKTSPTVSSYLLSILCVFGAYYTVNVIINITHV